MMLVYVRKKDEGFRVGDVVVVTVLAVKGDRVKIGIEAPKDVRIVRVDKEERETREVEKS